MNNQWTQTVIFIIALVSGVLTYDGLSIQVAVDDWWLKTLCAMTGAAITLSLSLFWTYAIGTVPELLNTARRMQGWAITLTGCIMIVSLSSYWNVVSLSGSTINLATSGAVIARTETRYSHGVQNAQKFRSFVADINAFRNDRAALQQREVNGGSSGRAGTGPVSNTMGQVVDRLDAVLASVNSSQDTLEKLQAKGATCLANMRAQASRGKINEAGKNLSCLNGVIGQMAGQNILFAMQRGLENLTSGIVLPANIRTKKQRGIIDDFIARSKTRGKEIAADIAALEQPHQPEPLTLERPNVMKGVLEHWQSIIPSIATALGIDLLPLVILLFKTVRFDDQRSRNAPRNLWTAYELLDALQQMKLLTDQQILIPSEPDLPDYIDLEVNPKTLDSPDDKETRE